MKINLKEIEEKLGEDYPDLSPSAIKTILDTIKKDYKSFLLEAEVESAFMTFQNAEKAYKSAENDQDKFDALVNMMVIEYEWTDQATENLKKKHSGNIEKMLEDLKSGYDFMYQMDSWIG